MKGRVRILKTSFTGRLRGASGDLVEVKSVVSHKDLDKNIEYKVFKA